MEQILNEYYENNAKKLHQVVDEILSRFGGLSDKDYDDFYSLANEVFVDVMRRYDSSQSFGRFLYSCLSNKIKSEITKRNRYKRLIDRRSVSLYEMVCDEDDMTIGDMIAGDFDLERESCFVTESVEEYLASVSDVQWQIIVMRIEGLPVMEIRRRLHLTVRQYERQLKECRSFYKRQFII